MREPRMQLQPLIFGENSPRSCTGREITLPLDLDISSLQTIPILSCYERY